MRDDWAIAFYRQAYSDWQLFEQLPKLENSHHCQALHYLQMATEKLAKAYRLRDPAQPIETIVSQHVGFAAFMNAFLLSPAMLREYKGRRQQLTSIRRDCERLALAVERLAPAVDRERHPENTEYPWATGDTVTSPLDYSFPDVGILRAPKGRLFLSIIRRAFAEFPERESATVPN